MLENTFNLLINMSIIASIAALLIVLLRWVFGRHFNKAFFYALWAIVLIRLLVPFSLPSVFSIFNVIPLAHTEINSKSHIYNVNDSISSNMAQQDSVSWNMPGDSLINGINSSVPSPNPEVSVDPIQVITFVFSWIWILGATVLFIFSIYAYLRTSHKLNEAVLYINDDMVLRCSKKIKLSRRIEIYTSDRIPTPVVFGLIKPRIILPLEIAEGCAESELEYIITHELVHIKRFDYIFKPVSVLALCLHWFNPVIWFSFILSQKDMEMACDEKVLSVFDTDIRSEYASSLIKLAVKKNIILNGGLLAFGESSIKSRIKGVMRFKKSGLFIGIASTIILIVIGTILLTNGQNNADDSIGKNIESENNGGADNRFGIYLVKDLKTRSAIEKNLDELVLESDPIITEKDMEQYNWSYHSFKLGKEVFDRIPNVPTDGLPFVVVADGERIYLGAFWTSLSSVSTTLPVIDVLLKDSVAINWGYPFTPEGVSDPRNDKRIYKVLEETDKFLKSYETETDAQEDSSLSSMGTNLWEKDGWIYYIEQIPRGGVIPLDNHVGRIYRQNGEGSTEILDELVAYRNNSAVIFPADDRIVFMGYAGTDVMDFKRNVIVSIKEDGSDRRTFNTEYSGGRHLCHDNGYLYFEGWTNDGAFPRPVCRLDTELTKNIKMADIDGSFITVYDGYAYYLNDSIYRLKLDWTSKPEIWDKAALGKKIVSIEKTSDNEYNVFYDESSKPYILRLPDEKRYTTR